MSVFKIQVTAFQLSLHRGTQKRELQALGLKSERQRSCVLPFVTSPVSSLWKQTLVPSGLVQLSRWAKKGRFAEGGRGRGRCKAVPVTTS